MKLRLIGLLSVAFAALGLALSPVATEAAEKYNIWYVNPLPNTPDWGRSARLFEEAADEMGYKATVTGPNMIDIPAMISQIEQAIADDADAIITCPLDPAAFKAVIDQAKAKGIIVASVACVDDNATFSMGTGNDAYGRTSADIIAEQTGGNACVGIIGTDATTPNQVLIVNGFRAQIAEKYPNIRECTWAFDNSDAGIAAQKFGAMIAAYPEMNYVWIIEGAAPGAVPSAFAEAGKKPGDIQVLAVDATPATLQAIRDGWISATLNQNFFDAVLDGEIWGKGTITRVIEAINGIEQPKFVNAGVQLITKDNLPE